jgi:hypothetical protein
VCGVHQYLCASEGVVYLVSVLRISEILVRIQKRIRILGSVPVTKESGCGSGRLKNIRILQIQICNTD